MVNLSSEHKVSIVNIVDVVSRLKVKALPAAGFPSRPIGLPDEPAARVSPPWVASAGYTGPLHRLLR